MASTAIEWTEKVWNPVTGCDRVSAGCDHCYAMTLAKRLKGMGSAKYQNDGDPNTSGPGFGVTIHPQSLDEPLKWNKPKRIFVNSMSDLFHAEVPDYFIEQIFAVMAASSQHTYQILTKRPARMRSFLRKATDRVSNGQKPFDHPYISGSTWPLRNVWLGVSAENQKTANLRVPKLLDTPAAVRFISAEPLLGPISLLTWLNGGFGHVAPDLHWVIAGGESGAQARPVDADWIRGLRDECDAAGLAFLFKQWGGRTPKTGGRELDGRTWDEYPEAM